MQQPTLSDPDPLGGRSRSLHFAKPLGIRLLLWRYYAFYPSIFPSYMVYLHRKQSLFCLYGRCSNGIF